MSEDSSLTRFTPTSIHQHVAEKNRTLFVRAVLGKQVAVVTTNVLQPSSLKDSLEKAIAPARVLPPNEDFLSLPGPKPIPRIETNFENVRRRTEEIAEAFMGSYLTEKTFASSEGSFIEQKIVECGAGIAATAIEGGEVQVRSYPNSFRGNFDDLVKSQNRDGKVMSLRPPDTFSGPRWPWASFGRTERESRGSAIPSLRH